MEALRKIYSLNFKIQGKIQGIEMLILLSKINISENLLLEFSKFKKNSRNRNATHVEEKKNFDYQNLSNSSLLQKCILPEDTIQIDQNSPQ